MADDKWKVKKEEGTIYGPVDTETLRRWIQEKRIQLKDYVSHADKEEWVEAKTLPQFQDLFVPVAKAISPSPGTTQCPNCGDTLSQEASFCVKCDSHLREGKERVVCGSSAKNRIQIGQAIIQGLKIIIKNPAILATVLIISAWGGVISYFFPLGPVPIPEPVYPPELLPLPAWLYLSFLASGFFTFVIYKMVYDAIIKNKVSFSQAVGLAARKFIFIIAGFIIYLLVMAAGFVALVVPGIFFSVKFWFFDYAILLHNEKAIDSFKKSWQITKGNWWRTFGLIWIFVIPIWALSAVATLIAEIPVPATLALSLAGSLAGSWFLSAFTVAYIQLTASPEEQNKEIAIT